MRAGAVFAACVGLAFAAPVVDTKYGAVEGFTQDGVDIFSSIPFAKPPLGTLRFQAPQPPEPWSGVKNVSAETTYCSQLKITGELFFGGEDCLYLHVYRPSDASEDEQLPVMLWLYGGGWITGDSYKGGKYSGVNLANKHRVIVVSPNYRLGPFGFMALDELAQEDSRGALGSMGLQDQRLAMQWTQDNIAAFGGDPTRVSIFGESAGAFSVCWHLVAPESKGLFRAAILESGTCDSPQFFRQKKDAVAFGKLYSEAIGCPGSGSGLLDCLRSKSTEEVMVSVLDFFDPNWPFSNSSEAGLAALIDGKDGVAQGMAARAATAGATCSSMSSSTSSRALRGAAPWTGRAGEDRRTAAIELLASNPGIAADALASSLSFFPSFAPVMPWGAPVDGVDLTDLPLGMIEKGQTNGVPTIFGTNKDEANLFVPALPIAIKGLPLFPTAKSFNETWQHLLGVYDPAKVRAVLGTINGAYTAQGYNGSQWDRLSTSITDYFFLCGMQRSARAWAQQGNDAYMYRFTRNPGWIDTDLLGDYHSVELNFAWDTPGHPSYHTFDADDETLAVHMGAYWTSMARVGAPEGDLSWPQYNGTASHIMRLDAPISIQPAPQTAQCRMWDNVIQALGPPL